MKIAVTGATGFIGRSLCAELVRRGHQVVALTGDPERARTVLPAAEAVHWSKGEPRPLPSVDAVVNLAGEPVAGRWTPEKKRRLRESRVDGTRRLVAAIRAMDPRPSVLVSVSAVGYYGDRGEETLTEASAPGDSFLAHLCRDWEAEAAQAEEIGVRVARLRLGVVLDRDGGALQQMLTPFRLGVGGPLGSGRQWFPWIHRADVVGLFLFALETPTAVGPVNAVAPEAVRNRDFTHTLGRILHRPTLLPAPPFALRLLLGEFAGELLGSQHVVPDQARALGYPFRFPQLEPALRDILEGTPHEDLSTGARSGRAPAA
jgi:uncharacterized protein (TIGR01777 family)